MSMEVARSDDKREVALLKAIGFDRLAPEQRELALNIANRYNLDPLLKHIVLIEGRVYVTRDGLLHVAHTSGALDGIVLDEGPELDGETWRAVVSVYRKDMAHPFRYPGRYPAKGGNAKFAPEMAVKVAEVMALRRAFDVAAPAAEERWDVEVPAAEPQKPVSLAERVAAKAAEIAEPDDEPLPDESQTDDYADMTAAPSLSKGEFNRRAVLAKLTKADVGAAHTRLLMPPSDEMTPAQWGALAAELGLA